MCKSTLSSCKRIFGCTNEQVGKGITRVHSNTCTTFQWTYLEKQVLDGTSNDVYCTSVYGGLVFERGFPWKSVCSVRCALAILHFHSFSYFFRLLNRCNVDHEQHLANFFFDCCYCCSWRDTKVFGSQTRAHWWKNAGEYHWYRFLLIYPWLPFGMNTSFVRVKSCIWYRKLWTFPEHCSWDEYIRNSFYHTRRYAPYKLEHEMRRLLCCSAYPLFGESTKGAVIDERTTDADLIR